MSILIKGMEMPHYVHQEIDFIPGINGKWYAIDDGSWCEVIPVPDHGDLIDRNTLGLTNFEIFMCNGDYKEALIMLLEKIDKAPAIIPVEEGE